MDAYQRCRRTVFWRGSFSVLLGFTFLCLALILADRTTPSTALEFDGVILSQQVAHSQKLGSQTTAPILAASE